MQSGYRLVYCTDIAVPTVLRRIQLESAARFIQAAVIGQLPGVEICLRRRIIRLPATLNGLVYTVPCPFDCFSSLGYNVVLLAHHLTYLHDSVVTRPSLIQPEPIYPANRRRLSLKDCYPDRDRPIVSSYHPRSVFLPSISAGNQPDLSHLDASSSFGELAHMDVSADPGGSTTGDSGIILFALASLFTLCMLVRACVCGRVCLCVHV